MCEGVNVSSQIRKIPKLLTKKIPPSLSINVSISILASSNFLPAVPAPDPKDKRKKKSQRQKATILKRKQESKLGNTNIF